jgi:hypothetical protein
MASGLRPFVLDRNIWHFLWVGVVAGDGLRSVGVDPSPHPRACALSCPSPFAGRGSCGAPAFILSLAALCGPPPSAAFALPGPMLHRLACADLRREWGTPPEVPPFPSRLLSKHMAARTRG